MGYAGNPRADHCIAQQIASLTRALVMNARSASAVYLSGSFGRGEGSVVSRGGDWRPLGDYDFYVIGPSALPAEHLENDLSALWESRFGGPGPSFGITVDVSRESALGGLPPDTSTYEFGQLARLVWGREARSRIRFGPRSIPVLSGIRALLNKLVGLLDHAPWVEGSSSIDLEYEVWKLYLDAVAALLLMEGRYVAGYRNRGIVFRTLSHLWDRVGVPGVRDKADWALDRKLRPEFSASDPTGLWQQSRDDLLILLLHTTGLRGTADPDRSLDRLVAWVRANYYGAWIRAFLRRYTDRPPVRLLCLMASMARRREARRFGAPPGCHVPAALYGAAAWCLWDPEGQGQAKAARLLHTAGLEVAGGRRELRRAVLRAFRRYRRAKGPKRGLAW